MTFEFASLLCHKNRNVHLGFQRGFIWSFNKVSFESSTEVQCMFDFHPNDPQWYKYLTHKARKKRRRYSNFRPSLKVGLFIWGFNMFKVGGFNGYSTNDSFFAERT
jgi:hypothetical protein